MFAFNNFKVLNLNDKYIITNYYLYYDAPSRGSLFTMCFHLIGNLNSHFIYQGNSRI